jgi:hypothetical protein
MTTRHTLQDERIVDQFLLDADMDDSAGLKDALLELRTLAAGPPPAPSADLAALMTPGPVSLDARRRRKHRRMAIAAIAVAASMGVGTAAVAATDPGFREKAQETITILINTVTNGPAAPPPGRPSPGHSPAPAAPLSPAHTAEPPAPVPGPPEHPGQDVPTLLTPGTPRATTPDEGRTGNSPAATDHQNRGSGPPPASPPPGRHGSTTLP